MTQQAALLPHTQVDILAAAAFALSREAKRVLSDVVPILETRNQELAQTLIQAINRRAIIQDSIVCDFDALLEILDEHVESGTVRATVWSDQDCDVSDSSYVETRRTPEAQTIASACRTLRALQEGIAAVLDRVHAERAVEVARETAQRQASHNHLAPPKALIR